MKVHEAPQFQATTSDSEALIKEARRLRRKRWAIGIALTAIIAAAIGIEVSVNGTHPKQPPIARTATTSSELIVDDNAMKGHGDLAFVSLGALYVIADGHLRKVVGQDADAGSPVYSPNGQFVAYDFGGNKVGVALADGSHSHTVEATDDQSNAIAAQWLPGGDLLVGTHRYAISLSGKAVRVKDAPAGLEAFSPLGNRYVFVQDSTKPAPGTSPAGTPNVVGTERIEVASSLFGPRQTWHSTPVRVDKSGAHGDYVSGAVVLPDKAGIVIWTDPDHDDDADGDHLYELQSPGGSLTPLGITVGHAITMGRDSTFSFSNGGPRVAWIGKSVVRCDGITARCIPVGTPKNAVTITPAWSPNGSTLAYVQAEAMSNWNFPQSVLTKWYATHVLFLNTGEGAPVMVKGSQGATDPVWSADGKNLLFVKNDGLYLLPREGGVPVAIAKPLLVPTAWGSYYGQINWVGNFSWSQGAG